MLTETQLESLVEVPDRQRQWHLRQFDAICLRYGRPTVPQLELLQEASYIRELIRQGNEWIAKTRGHRGVTLEERQEASRHIEGLRLQLKDVMKRIRSPKLKGTT